MNFYKIVSFSQVSGEFITSIGEELNSQFVDNALKGADTWIPLAGTNDGPFFLMNEKGKDGFQYGLPNPQENPVQFALFALNEAKLKTKLDTSLILYNIQQWMESKGYKY
jgi:hypothetical protein